MEIAEQLFLKSLFFRRKHSDEETKELAVELDCLVAKRKASNFQQCEVIKEAASAIDILHRKGFRIIIFSANQGNCQVASKWLNDKRISFDEFSSAKPRCDLIIDNKTVVLDGWKGILKRLT
jgi:hypothetical protein